jgi:small multidrug resistance family-3 protein
MNRNVALAFLLLAALLEAGGDAVIRAGLHAPNSRIRWLLMAAGAAMLFAYGYTVNAPGWDFGRLLGVYIVLLFLVAQIVSWLAFGQRPGTALLIGGALIVAGGVVIVTQG